MAKRLYFATIRDKVDSPHYDYRITVVRTDGGILGLNFYRKR